jgi:ribosome-associated toxin RatA of RatAB toxin-antitoxin module
MSIYRHSAVAAVPADEMFAFLRDPRNLPRYFPQLTIAEPVGGGEVRVEADVRVRRATAEAWLCTDAAHRSLAWGSENSENEDNYHGELRITERDPGTCEIAVVLHTERADGAEVQRALERTVAILAQTVSADTSAHVEEIRRRAI